MTQERKSWSSDSTEAPTNTVGALSGVRVVDFSRVLAGPYASMMLADLGADVVKVESPSGDDTRSWTPPVDASGRGTYFASVNRNKRSVVCDLRDRKGGDEARRLIQGADVVIENFRPGTMKRFGLDFDALSQENPALVYCSVTGFGAGNGAHLPGYDLLVQAVGGLMSITGDPSSEPTKAGVALVDVLTGQNAVIGIQAALRVAARTGVGQHVEVNLLSSLLAAMVNQASATVNTGAPPTRVGNAHPSIAPYETFTASDGPFVIAVGNNGQFARLADVIGLPYLTEDLRFVDNSSRVAHRLALRSVLEKRISEETIAHWVSLLTADGVPSGPINDLNQAFDFAAELGLRPTTEITDGGRTSVQISNPIALSKTPASYRRVPPDLGEHDGAHWLHREGTS